MMEVNFKEALWFSGDIENLSPQMIQETANIELYICNYCAKDLTTKRGLQYHQQAVHNRTGTNHQCPVCAKIYLSKSKLKYHNMSHTGEKPFTCALCQKAFYDTEGLRKHQRTHTDIKPFACDQCAKSCNYLSNLKRHKKTHIEEVNTFICDQPKCEYKGKDYDLLKQHKTIHGEKLSCDQCLFNTLTQRSLERHRELKHTLVKYICDWPRCEYEGISSGFLKRHMKSHTQFSINKLLPTNEKLDVSQPNKNKSDTGETNQMPEKKLSESISLLDKRRSITLGGKLCKEVESMMIVGPWVNLINKPSKRKRLWICQVCGKELAKYFLISHIENKHLKNLYNCSFCNIKLLSAKSLMKHEGKIHKKKFQCEKCPYLSHAIEDHTNKQHGNTIHLCEYCEYKTTSLRNLKSHMLNKHIPATEKRNSKTRINKVAETVVKNDIVNYKCRKCSYCTGNRSNIYKHQVSHLNSGNKSALIDTETVFRQI